MVLLLISATLSLAGAAPDSPFRYEGKPSRTCLDLCVAAVTNRISPVSMLMTNGRDDVLVLPIRVENRSSETVTAKFAHEWFGGEWPPTDLQAAARRVADPAGDWQATAAFLVGEVGSRTPPTVWKPGESHTFALRLNWPGTGSCPARPLIDTKVPGKYVVRVAFTFKTANSWEYCEGPEMNIEVLEKKYDK